MPSAGSITKTVRINAEDKEYMERLMEENGLTWSGVVHYLANTQNPKKRMDTEGTPKTAPNIVFGKKDTKEEGTNRQDLMDRAVERELKKMCRANSISTHDFFRGIMNLWERDKIEIDGEKVRSYGRLDVKRFEELCYILNQDPQKVINMMVRSLEKGVQ